MSTPQIWYTPHIGISGNATNPRHRSVLHGGVEATTNVMRFADNSEASLCINLFGAAGCGMEIWMTPDKLRTLSAALNAAADDIDRGGAA
ncbi:hypothetical protein D8I35_09540 [Corticibacter populi]|uniref:Uncharacterized protein n=1 Tax=Corticibacter populi TaxID=1550736 RepID=A0A3M6QUM8_9BURK|nr:hypothetical protein [Corticibacter populi]RMX06734.1 hypothetical protein D8I35_09540 [Corticibacter populi]RZS31684.1 hypothetical protein EV687_2353 [Corticibacter populi]